MPTEPENALTSNSSSAPSETPESPKDSSTSEPKKRLVVPSLSPVDVLVAKLEGWVTQQPEWLVLLAAPRNVRRQAVSRMSKTILTFPKRGSNFGSR